MKLEFKHFAYIALAIVALYLAYKHLVKGPEVIEPGTNGNTASGTSTRTGGTTSGTSTGRVTGGTSTGRIATGEAVVRPVVGEVETTNGKDPHVVVHEEVSEGASNYNSGRVASGTATPRNSDTTSTSSRSSGTSTGSGVTRR